MTGVSATIIVSPHLDDAVLSCWSLLTRLAAGAVGGAGATGSLAGLARVTVIDVCAGLPPEGVLGDWDERGGATSSRVRVRERRAEEAEVLAGLGAEVVLLDLLDWQYGPQVEDVAAALRPQLAGAGWVFAPAGIGGHRDHLRVRDAVLSLCPDAILYADLPYALRQGSEPPLPGYQPEQILLDADEAAANVAAIARYATQVPLLELDFGPVLDPGTMARETLFHRV